MKVLPLSFPEFIEVKGFTREEVLFDTDLQRAPFKEYKEKGGFPKPVNGNPDAEESFIDGLVSDINGLVSKPTSSERT